MNWPPLDRKPSFIVEPVPTESCDLGATNEAWFEPDYGEKREADKKLQIQIFNYHDLAILDFSIGIFLVDGTYNQW